MEHRANMRLASGNGFGSLYTQPSSSGCWGTALGTPARHREPTTPRAVYFSCACGDSSCACSSVGLNASSNALGLPKPRLDSTDCDNSSKQTGKAMILDDLCSRSSVLWETAISAHVIRVPFPVYPCVEHCLGFNFSTINMDPHLAPFRREGGDMVLDGSMARPPYPTTILVGEASEQGVLILDYTEAAGVGVMHRACLLGRHSLYRDELIARVGLFAIKDGDWKIIPEPKYPALVQNVVEATEVPDGYAGTGFVRTPVSLGPDVMQSACAEFSLRDAEATAIFNGWSGVRTGPVMQSGDTEQAFGTYICRTRYMAVRAAAAFSFLNCRNVEQVPVDVPQELNRARQRRGKPPLLKVYTLVVRPLRLDRRKRESKHGPPVAIHWVRGHFKRYTEERKLFGKFTGTYWWQHHVAGKAQRFIIKDYAVRP